MSSWHSYPKIYNVGHAAIQNIFDDHVRIEEKVDGSQFSFGIFDGVLRFRSKGAEMLAEAPEKMFLRGVEEVRAVTHLLWPGWTYRGEYLQKPKHNALAYDRIPMKHVALFDINHQEEGYCLRPELEAEATRLGFDAVPLLFDGLIDAAGGLEFIKAQLERVSFLGGQKIEGVVIKARSTYGKDGKLLMAKHVSEGFREVHKREWKAANPRSADIVTFLGAKYSTKARWNKALIHLAEQGQLQNAPQDIGPLIAEIKRDVGDECAEEIKQALCDWALPSILRQITRGLPEWYKEHLLAKQFEAKEVA